MNIIMAMVLLYYYIIIDYKFYENMWILFKTHTIYMDTVGDISTCVQWANAQSLKYENWINKESQISYLMV